MDSFLNWVEKAASLPVAFAQVREDALLDQWVVKQLGPQVDLLMVASGGCTAALLAADSRVRRLHLVDPNPAQLALTSLKLWLLQNADRKERLSVLDHATMPPTERAARVESILNQLNLPVDTLGPQSLIAEIGPDHCGRYEWLFAALQTELTDVRDELHAALLLTDVDEQRRRIDGSTALGHRMQEALDQVMALPVLVRLFGKEATNNPAQPFVRHFLWRIQYAFQTLPARTNPYLWQMLHGTYPDGHSAPWLDVPRVSQLPAISYANQRMDSVLESETESFDFVHLSNILDWLAPEEARRTLELAWKALRPGGRVLIRQLNSTLDVPRLGPQFEWLNAEAEALHQRDRSFFYRGLHLGVKR